MNAQCNLPAWKVPAFSLILLALVPNSAICEDLRDRRLPSEKALERATTNTPAEIPQSRPIVPRSVYENFRKDVLGLTPEKKKELEKMLRERIVKARASGEEERATYNLTLLGILKEN